MGPSALSLRYSPSRIFTPFIGRLSRWRTMSRGNVKTTRSSQRARNGGSPPPASASSTENPACEFSPPRITPGIGMRFTTGSNEVFPEIPLRGIEARRNAGGIVAAIVPRESGAATTSESKCASDFSKAASPIGSGDSHASTAAVAAFFAPKRRKFVKITARSMGAGGEDWKNPSRSSSSTTTTGALQRSNLDLEEKVRSFHGSL